MLRKLFLLIAKTFFKKVTIEGTENLPSSGPLIFTPNHPNALIDPILLYFLPSSYKIRFVAKAPLFNIPLLGWLMRKLKAIPVVRRFEADGNIDYQAFFASCVDALSAGESITIFPEGASLPQPHMTTLRTGAARLYFLAWEKGIDVSIIPVALNYEHGSTFRTSVVVSFSPPIVTTEVTENYKTSPNAAVRKLTAQIAQVLNKQVFQATSFRDRELLLLLEKIYGKKNSDSSWPEKLDRLKRFEDGMSHLRDSCSSEIERLRHMLLRYERLNSKFGNRYKITGNKTHRFFKKFLKLIFGLPFAVLGAVFNLLPYQLCRIIVIYVKKYDEASAATYKVVYSLFLFPLFYIGEGFLIYICFGSLVSIPFAIIIIPLSYFTLFFLEWFYDDVWGFPISSFLVGNKALNRVTIILDKQRCQINKQVDALADKLDTHNGQ